MMVRAGLLSDDQLAAVQARSAERKLSFVESLLELGVIDEDSVVSFLHSKLMIPRVGASVLDTVDKGALLRIPAELAQKLAVLPISADETGNLTIAMVDPTDMRAVDAISAHTGAYLVRAVAPLRIIRAAISKHYNIPMPEAAPALSAPAVAPRPAAVTLPASAAGPAPARVPPSVTPPATTSPTANPPAPTAPAEPDASLAAGQRTITGTGSASASGSLHVAPAAVPPQSGGVAQPSVVIPRPATAPAVAPDAHTLPGRNKASASGAHPAASGPTELPRAPEPAPVAPTPTSTPDAPPTSATSTTSSTSSIKPSAVLRPSAVLQPSAVLMPGGTPVSTPRPAVVLPASAMSSAPYGAPIMQAPVPAVFIPNPTQPPGPKPGAEAKAPLPSQENTVIGHAPVGGQPNASPPAPVQPAPSQASAAQATARRASAPQAAAPLPADFQPGGTATFEPAPARKPATTPQPAVADAPEKRPVEVTGPSETMTGGSRSDVVDIPLDDLDDDAPPTPTSTPTINPEDRTTATWTPPQFGVANEVIPLSPEAFHRLLPRFATVKTRDEVTDLLLDFLAEGFARVIMFTHIKGEIRGRDARGEDLMVEAVRQIRIPATGPSLFSGVIERRQPYFGAMRTDTAIDAAFYSALGGVDGVVLCLPVILRDKVPLLVFASGSHNPVDPRSLHDLTHEVAAALERIIVADKTRGAR
ncbi:MAG TPA: hypothetical protein VGB85_14720 [Nannocystis sp.]